MDGLILMAAFGATAFAQREAVTPPPTTFRSAEAHYNYLLAQAKGGRSEPLMSKLFTLLAGHGDESGRDAGRLVVRGSRRPGAISQEALDRWKARTSAR